MNITSVQVNSNVIPPPYEFEFSAGASNSAWEIFASNFDELAFNDDPIAKAEFEIKGVRTINANVIKFPLGQNPTHWRTDPNVYPVSVPGVLQLKSLWTASGKLRWMNPNS